MRGIDGVTLAQQPTVHLPKIMVLFVTDIAVVAFKALKIGVNRMAKIMFSHSIPAIPSTR